MNTHDNKTDRDMRSLADVLPDEGVIAAKTIRRVVKIGCLVNILLMVMKLAIGYWGHSDALMADGFHSLNDVAADLIMLIFIGISYRHADARYTYGYGKFETFASFLISVFLLLISAMIISEAVESTVEYFKGAVLPQPDIWTIVAVLVAMACKEGLYRFYSHAGRKAGSNALVASAWHHRSDALASIATLIGVTFSHFLGEGFRILDPLASMVIAVFIFIPALRIFLTAFRELMEKSLPAADVGRVRTIVESTPGVKEITYLRTRRNGHNLLFDIGIGVSPNITVTDGAAIAGEIERSIQDAYCRHVLVSVTTTPC